MKKPVRRATRRIPPANKNKKHVVITLFTLCVVAGILVFAVMYFSQPKESFESPKNEMGKLPLDVAQNLLEQKNAHPLLSTIRVPILMYHYVEYVQDKGDTIRQSLDITPNAFEDQVQTLKNAGYTFMTARELGDVLDGKAQLPSNPILLTFDDGHWDFDTVVLPILEKYHARATAYIISGFLGGSDFMTPEELQDVVQSGLVDVGAHTVHHIALKGQPVQLVLNEVAQSKKDIEKQYHLHVVSFAYPAGSFDQQAIDAVKSAGFTTAVSTIPGIEQNHLNRYFLFRLRPGYRTGADLLSFLQQSEFHPY